MVDHESLSEREIEILRLVATGASNKQIAHDLYISANTVKVHLRNIFEKTGAASRTEATVYAIRDGLVSMESDQEEGASLISDLSRSSTSDSWQTILRRPWPLAILGVLSFAVGMILIQGIRHSDTTPVNSPSPEVVAHDRWKSLADMPTARSGLAVATYENLIYAIGGESESGVTGKVERYDPVSDSWVGLQEKPVAVADIEAAVVGGRIYIPGGLLSTGEVTNILEIYDPRLDRWDRGADLPVRLSAYALVAFEGRLYVFGGWDGAEYVSSAYSYDPVEDEWEVRTSMPTARGYAGAVVASGAIYVLGGYDGTKALQANEVYIPERDNTHETPWLTAASLPEGRYAMGVASVAEIVYLVGGVPGDDLKILLIYSPQQDKWQMVDEIPPIKTWSHHGLAVIETYIYALGGKVEGDLAQKNLSYRAIYTILLPFAP
jgi:DNA-binding CsgD family transcriptional regulator/N-acetylneuraminic acid mutarotase